jgi:multidrug efflux pump
LAQISRVDQERYYDVKADVESGLHSVSIDNPNGDGQLNLAMIKTVPDGLSPRGEVVTDPKGTNYTIYQYVAFENVEAVQQAIDGGAKIALVNANERIAKLTEWLETGPLDPRVSWEWTGDQDEQAESGAFLSKAFAGALALMFVILLAQFNSFYNAVLVLLAVVLSTTGVLIGMMVMQQPFSIIMTGTGIVALAGIVVNNNIVLIDTYQEFSQQMPRIEAIIRTAEARIRPVLLTTVTTMAGLAPMMFGISLDFIGGGYSIDSPTALWWKQLATAVVFGLGIATVLTLVVTPSLLAIRVWLSTYLGWMGQLMARLTGGRSSRIAQDMRLAKKARKLPTSEILWDDLISRTPLARSADQKASDTAAPQDPGDSSALRAAE